MSRIFEKRKILEFVEQECGGLRKVILKQVSGRGWSSARSGYTYYGALDHSPDEGSGLLHKMGELQGYRAGWHVNELMKSDRNRSI